MVTNSQLYTMNANSQLVIYHLPRGDFTIAWVIKELPDGDAFLTVDLRNPIAGKYVDDPAWWPQSFVNRHDGLVPDRARKGTGPGEWQTLASYIADQRAQRREIIETIKPEVLVELRDQGKILLCQYEELCEIFHSWST